MEQEEFSRKKRLFKYSRIIMTYKGLLNRKNLPKNGIFVFGSNPVGINGNPRTGKGGAALIAQLEFGVKHGELMNNCLSKSGKAYGLVTVDAPKKYISEDRIKENIKKLYSYASQHVDKLLYIAYDGLNPDAVSLNGKTRKTLANLFYQAGLMKINAWDYGVLNIPENIVFEENFYKLVISCSEEKGFEI